jgi:cytidine deaminase/SAM-dependent methyltransferase
MTKDELIAAALGVVNPHGSGHRTFGDVGATLVTDRGNAYSGVSIDTGSGTGFCAEHSAIAAMVTAGEYRIAKIVAVWKDRDGTPYVLPPCGRCREFIRQIDEANLDAEVVLGRSEAVPLRELLPRHEWPLPLEGVTRPDSSLGAIFDQAAERYDRIRPRYPPELFRDLAKLARLGPGSTILELGAGTGQATVALAESGLDVTALEPGPSLAAIARRNLARFANARVVESRFEEWDPAGARYDAVMAATSFHWIEPAVRAQKAADVLHPGGSLAIVSTHHVAGGDTTFFEQVQACYERWDPSTPPGLTLPDESEVPKEAGELDRSGRFGPSEFRRYFLDQTYSADDYVDLLLTYSGHLALAPERRGTLLSCISKLIRERFAGRITKRYLFQLQVSRLAG